MGPQDLLPGSDKRDETSGTTKEPASSQGIEAISETTRPSTGEWKLQIWKSHNVIHFKIVQTLLRLA